MKILIADDDKSITFVIEKFLEDKGLDFKTTGNGDKALAYLNKGEYEIALLDINMPGLSGLEILKEIKKQKINTEIVIMTAEGTMEKTVTAIKEGAFDYLSKPFDIDELDLIIEKAIKNLKLKSKVDNLEKKLKETSDKETAFIGKSKAIIETYKTIGKVSRKDVNVLITGESGTGKELVSHLIHQNSLRADHPFVAVNTAAIPKELIESELFGYEKGAFTGARETTKGKFELAQNGTLFLDEIGDMAIDVQAKLLRALQDKEFYRVGGRAPIKVDIRIISATNHDIQTLIKEGSFREDLFFRINTIAIQLPPLRERQDDIELLTNHFMNNFTREMGLERKSISKNAFKSLKEYSWPGNIRELENVLRRALLLTQNFEITEDDLNLPQSEGEEKKEKPLEDIIYKRIENFIKIAGKDAGELHSTFLPFMERPLIRLVLKETNYNQLKTADMLGINRNTLRKKIKELNIDIQKEKEY